MNWREVGEADLTECLNIEPRIWGDEIVGRERALRDTEKQLLTEAMNGETDNELAARMNLSLPSIKKRWASLFDRIADTRPDLLPGAEHRGWHESRGPQKRHRILAYVRSHPEELRPFRWRSHRY